MYKYWKESKRRVETESVLQAWCWDALCMYIGLLMEELRGSEAIRNPPQDIVQFTAPHAVSLCIWWVFLQNHSIVALFLI